LYVHHYDEDALSAASIETYCNLIWIGCASSVVEESLLTPYLLEWMDRLAPGRRQRSKSHRLLPIGAESGYQG
jgi:hypothetical protein